MSIIALLYATAQLVRDAHRLSSGRDLVAGRKAAAVVDFAGDQVPTPSRLSVCLTTNICQPALTQQPERFPWSETLSWKVVAYSLISGLSAAAPVTDYMRQATDNLFNDSAAAAISLAFFAFLAISLSALISGYNLSLEAIV
ncbi:CASP-like protein 4B3 [Hordeum vulgare]|nr:CASP-like protein 4B3 [Hordeum vulgare]